MDDLNHRGRCDKIINQCEEVVDSSLLVAFFSLATYLTSVLCVVVHVDMAYDPADVYSVHVR